MDSSNQPPRRARGSDHSPLPGHSDGPKHVGTLAPRRAPKPGAMHSGPTLEKAAQPISQFESASQQAGATTPGDTASDAQVRASAQGIARGVLSTTFKRPEDYPMPGGTAITATRRRPAPVAKAEASTASSPTPPPAPVAVAAPAVTHLPSLSPVKHPNWAHPPPAAMHGVAGTGMLAMPTSATGAAASLQMNQELADSGYLPQQGLAFGQRWGQSNFGIGGQSPSPPPTSGPKPPPGSSGSRGPGTSGSNRDSISSQSNGGPHVAAGYSHAAAGYSAAAATGYIAAAGNNVAGRRSQAAQVASTGAGSAAPAPNWLAQQQQQQQAQQRRPRQPGDDALDSFKAAGGQQQQQQVLWSKPPGDDALDCFKTMAGHGKGAQQQYQQQQQLAYSSCPPPRSSGANAMATKQGQQSLGPPSSYGKQQQQQPSSGGVAGAAQGAAAGAAGAQGQQAAGQKAAASMPLFNLPNAFSQPEGQLQEMGLPGQAGF